MKLRDELRNGIAHLRHKARRIKDQVTGNQQSTMVHLMRPQLGDVPPSWRPVIEPLVAVGAGAVLMCLMGIGLMSLTVFVVVGALIYAILTYIFGIDLAVQVPAAGF